MNILKETYHTIAQKVERIINGECVTRLAFEVTIFSKDFIDNQAEGILHFYEIALKQGEGKYHYYQTETMRESRPLEPDVLEMVPFWITDPRAARTQAMITLTSGKTPADVSGYQFELAAGTFDSFALRLVIPWEKALEGEQSLLDLGRDLTSSLAFSWGIAGLSVVWYPASAYIDEVSKVLRMVSLRHPGIDIGELGATRYCAHEGLKSISWLTFLNEETVRQLGGLNRLKQQLGETIPIHHLAAGIAIQAGDWPLPGDVNRGLLLSEYHRVGNALRKLRALNHPAIIPDDDNSELTSAWLARFDENAPDA